MLRSPDGSIFNIYLTRLCLAVMNTPATQSALQTAFHLHVIFPTQTHGIGHELN